ncbi:MAG TPA: endonuclease domain-containing protein [Hyphomicrobiaceae bacterium]|nr:endonuclease domain-containing protein [Hyphomicrobiaceae bacterium]
MTTARARLLRAKSTPSERALWEALRRRQQWGLRFRRQHPIGPFVVDFVCLERRLIVEVDGEAHDHAGRIQADIERDRWLESQRFRIVRIPGGIVTDDPGRACAMIAKALGPQTVAEAISPHPRPFPRKGGREESRIEASSRLAIRTPKESAP